MLRLLLPHRARGGGAPLSRAVGCYRQHSIEAAATAPVTESETVLQSLKQFILENSAGKTDPKMIHVASLRRFYQLYPDAKDSIGRAAIDASSSSGLRWVARSRGQVFIEVVPSAINALGDHNVSNSSEIDDPTADTLSATEPSLDDIVFPEPPSAALLHEGLSLLRQYMLDRLSHCDPVRLSSADLSKFVTHKLKQNDKLKQCVSRAMIEMHGHTVGLRWVQTKKVQYVEIVDKQPTAEPISEVTAVMHETASDGQPAVEVTAVMHETASDGQPAVEVTAVIHETASDGQPAVEVGDVMHETASGGQPPIAPASVATQADPPNLRRTLQRLREYLKCCPSGSLPVAALPLFYARLRYPPSRLSRRLIDQYGAEFGIEWRGADTEHDQNISLSARADPPRRPAQPGDENAAAGEGGSTVSDQYAISKLRSYIETKAPSGLPMDQLTDFFSEFPDLISVFSRRGSVTAFIKENGTDAGIFRSNGLIKVREARRYADDEGSAALIPLRKRPFFMSFKNGQMLRSLVPFDPPAVSVREASTDADDARSDLKMMAAVLPPHIAQVFTEHEAFAQSIELVLDVGRPPLLRSLGSSSESPVRGCWLPSAMVTRADLAAVCSHPELGRFNSGNRAGLSTTLHRISRKLNRHDEVIGLTMRVGRSVEGSTKLITDLVWSNRSVLLLGRPGVGKTSVLREYARLLAVTKRVEVVDTSNEIAGDGDSPHRSVGDARRMMVKHRDEQHTVMIEAVQNHMPQCIIVDEIGTKAEAQAAADIAQRGVQIVATAHGTELRHLLQSPELDRLVGGVHTVVVGDDHMKMKNLASKSVQERMGVPVFDTLVEMHSAHQWVVYSNLAGVVDMILDGKNPPCEYRTVDPSTGQMTIQKGTSQISKIISSDTRVK